MKLRACNIVVCRGGKLILNLENESFEVRPGTLTAIVGPNGAGKTTLMRALSGERPDAGQVLINGEEDLYDEPEYWLQQIGYVPVDNILHDHLTPKEALMYIGMLRRPGTPLKQIEARVDELLTTFDFPPSDARRNKLIRVLSSGERKRANVCSELIIDPPILMLDEPTSNLDPDAEYNLMHLLARYAHENNKTVLVITHTLNTVDICDDVIFIANSRLRAQGEPPEVLEKLEGSVSLAQTGLRRSEFERWAHVFQENKTDPERRQDCAKGPPSKGRSVAASVPVSPGDGDSPVPATSEDGSLAPLATGQLHLAVAHEAGTPPEVPQSQASATLLTGPPVKLDSERAQGGTARNASTASWLHQFRCLLSRYMKVRIADRWNLIGTLMAGCSGILFFTLPGKTFVRPFDASETGLALNQARQSVYVVVLVVTLIGLITSYTEISKEFRIFRHERLKGLSPAAYFMSKWLWLTLSVGVLAPIVLLLFMVLIYGQPLPDFPEPRIGQVVSWQEQLFSFQLVGLLTTQASWLILLTLVLACIASVTLGLLISAVAGDSGKGYLLLSFAVVFIILFSGLLENKQLQNLVDTFSVASTGKWAYEGVASSLSIYCWTDSWRFSELNSTGHIASVWIALLAFTLLAGFLAVLALRVRDPWYTRPANLRRFFVADWKRAALVLSIVGLLFSYTVFLRDRSYEYHALNYWSRQQYGGTNALEFANISKVADPDALQLWNGVVSQSWCGAK
jgi:ABC-type multidrug transport system ATPase subunit